jgi:hypothetical protein
VNTAARLTVFGALLALVFAVAAFAGERIDWTPQTSDDASARGGHVDGEHMAAERASETSPGLAVSEDGVTLALDRTRLDTGRATPLRFRIVGEHGETVRNFDVEHTKRMHFIVVRRDLTGFQHLHPTLGRDGTWRVALRLPEPGSYRVFADFAIRGEKHTLGADISVDGTVAARPLPAPAPDATVAGYRLTLDARGARAGRESGLRFSVTQDGRPVALQPYLGARGHLVALRDGDLAFLHVHPDADALSFMTEFPSAGRYRLFLQFRHGGAVHTAAFTQDVTS